MTTGDFVKPNGQSQLPKLCSSFYHSHIAA